MGYNNHNAGMHFIRYSHYGQYDDLEYYERLAERKRKEMQKAKAVVIAQEVEPVKVQAEISTIVSDKTSDVKARNSSEIFVKECKMETEGKTTNTEKASKPQNNKQKSGNKQGKKDFWTEFYNPPKPPAGTEQCIENHHLFDVGGTVLQNMMIIAMRNKADIWKIIKDVEELMARDSRTNPPRNSELLQFPKMDNVMVFLSLMAERLECEVFELFINNDKRRRSFIYRLIDEIEEDFLSGLIELGGIDTSGAVEFTIPCFDYHYKMTTEYRPFNKINKNVYTMDLAFSKDFFEDGTPVYEIAFGSLMIYRTTQFEYTSKGAYLWDEKEGKLAEYIEKQIANHPEWRDEMN